MPEKGLELMHVELKRDTWLSPERTVKNADDAVQIVRDLIKDLDREMVVCINLASSGQVINASVCSVGTLDQALISPAEILRGTLLSGARNVIILHNHPSASLSVSQEDLKATKRMATASAAVGVNLLDSIIIGGEEMISLKERSEAYLQPADCTVGLPVVAEAQPEYISDGEGRVKAGYVMEHRKAVVEQMISMIQAGETSYKPQWNRGALRPRNPISGAMYHGGNRLILMQSALKNGYKDPRWMTFKQLSAKGYHVKKGEHSVQLEKWDFTKREKKLGPDDKPLKDPDGHYIYEERLLNRPLCTLFRVFNVEQIQDFPLYEQDELLEGVVGERIEALLASSECPIHELAQDRSFYSPSVDEIFLPLRSAFRDQNAFAEVAAHEMIHSTGHASRLAREFGARNAFGNPDEKYCMEELRAELGALFLMGDIGIPPIRREMTSAAAYLESYLDALRENPNLLFRIAADADKASEFLFDNFCKVYTLTPSVEKIPDRKEYLRNKEKMDTGAKPVDRRESVKTETDPKPRLQEVSKEGPVL